MPNKPSRTTFQHRLNEMITNLRSAILTGNLPKGQFLPSIAQLGKQYHLSINSVQKGLNQLEAEALIERLPRVGTRVKTSVCHEGITLSLGCYPSLLNDLELGAIIEQFHMNHPNITIQLVPLQYDHYDEVTRHHLENELVDIVTINHINFLDFDEETELLSELFEPLEAHTGVHPFLIDTFVQGKKRYAQPIAFSPVLLCYNKRLIEESGQPLPSSEWTWQDFMAYLEHLDHHSESGMSFHFYPVNYNRWPIFLLQSGIPLNNKEPGAPPMEISLIDGMQTCYNLIHRNKHQMMLSDHDFNVEDMFAQQKISIMMTTYFNLNKLRRETDLPFELAPLPYVHKPKTMLLTIGLAINQRSKHKQAAMDFINHVLSYRSQLLIRKHTYSIPALQAAADWNGEEDIYRPSSFYLYKDLTNTYAQLSDLHLSKREKEALLRIMKMYWTYMIDKEEAIALLNDLRLPAHIIIEESDCHHSDRISD